MLSVTLCVQNFITNGPHHENKNIHRFWLMILLFLLRNNWESLVHMMYTFAALCLNQAVKVRAWNNILKALTGTTWEQQKETIILTYQAIGRSVINCAAPVWAPVINESSWKCFQTAQNEALQIATGCHKMAHSDHFHQETKMLPVKSHSELLAKQYWLSCFQPHHPGHYLVASQPQLEIWRARLINLTGALYHSVMMASLKLSNTVLLYAIFTAKLL